MTTLTRLQFAALLLFVTPLSTFALASGSVVFDPVHTVETVFNGVTEAGSLAQETLSTASQVADNTKSYSLDVIASKLANNLIVQAEKQTLNWIASGFKGSPLFIVNPAAYFKNVANDTYRGQIASLKSSNSPLANSLANQLITSVRNDRADLGTKLQGTLGTAIKSDICNDATLTRMAKESVNSGLSSGNSSGGNTDAQVEAAKRTLYSRYCTQTTNTAQQQTQLDSCYRSGQCFTWNSYLASNQPDNTRYGQRTLVTSEAGRKAATAVDQAKGETTGGLIPNKKCIKRVPGNYPDPDTAPCLEYATINPSQFLASALDQSLKGDYGKLPNASTLGSVLVDLAVAEATNVFSKGLQNTFNGNTAKGGPNVAYDNLVSRDVSALPADLQGTPAVTVPQVDPAQAARNLADAQAACADESNKNYEFYSAVCNHLASNLKTKDIDTQYSTAVRAYNTELQKLATCVDSIIVRAPGEEENDPTKGWKSDVDDRKDYLATFKEKLDQRTRVIAYSINTLATVIVGSAKATDIQTLNKNLTYYASIVVNPEKLVPQGQEQSSRTELSSFRSKSRRDLETELPKRISACQEHLSSLDPSQRHDCPVNACNSSCPNYTGQENDQGPVCTPPASGGGGTTDPNGGGQSCSGDNC